MKKKDCGKCGVVFRFPSYLSRKYCSVDCYHAAHRKTLVCPMCFKSRVVPLWKNQEYCSVKCVGKQFSIKPKGGGVRGRMLGIKKSAEHRKSISNAKTGVALSLEHREKMRKSPSEEVKEKISKTLSGRRLSQETKDKISKVLSGENGPGWKGGISRAYKTGYWSLEYKRWREAVFKRDDWRCQWCSVRGGVKIQADHIFPFSLFPNKRFLVRNGRTLCEPCHRYRTKIQLPFIKSQRTQENPQERQ